jgi:hypothetical protein
VISTDDFISPIGVYADCGRIGSAAGGRATGSFTLFVQPGPEGPPDQVNTKMNTHAYRRGGSGKLKTDRVFGASPPGAGRQPARFGPPAREGRSAVAPAELIKRAPPGARARPSRAGAGAQWSAALRGKGSRRATWTSWAGLTEDAVRRLLRARRGRERRAIRREAHEVIARVKGAWNRLAAGG